VRTYSAWPINTRFDKTIVFPNSRQTAFLFSKTAFYIPQPKVSGMMHGDFTNLSERKLMDCLNRLGYDIEIKVRPAAEPIGHLTLATV
jgi:hypothetical protein